MIEATRLLLRPHHIDDFDAYRQLWAQAPPAGAPNARPLGEEEAFARLLRWIGHRAVFGFAPFLVIDRLSGTVAGEVGFAYFRRGLAFDQVPEAQVPEAQVPEAMWRIDQRRQGTGIATEAMQAVLAWFDARPEATRSVCMIDPPNVASRRLAASLGFREFARAVYRDNPVLLFERLRGG